MHGHNSRKPLEGQSYGTNYGGRVLARRGKSGRRKAPPRPRPTTQSPPPGFPIPQAPSEPTPRVPQPAVDSPALPVQKQYGEVETTNEPTSPIAEVEKQAEEIKAPEDNSDESPTIVSEELVIQDGAERRSLGLTTREVIVEKPEEIKESDEERTSAYLRNLRVVHRMLDMMYLLLIPCLQNHWLKKRKRYVLLERFPKRRRITNE